MVFIFIGRPIFLKMNTQKMVNCLYMQFFLSTRKHPNFHLPCISATLRGRVCPTHLAVHKVLYASVYPYCFHESCPVLSVMGTCLKGLFLFNFFRGSTHFLFFVTFHSIISSFRLQSVLALSLHLSWFPLNILHIGSIQKCLLTDVSVFYEEMGF